MLSDCAGKRISEEEDEVKYFVPSSTQVGCGCFEVVVDSDRFATTTSRMLGEVFCSGVINFAVEPLIITSFLGGRESVQKQVEHAVADCSFERFCVLNDVICAYSVIIILFGFVF